MEAHVRTAVATASFLVILMAARAAGQSQICGVELGQLVSCKPAATPPNPQPPSSECCQGLSGADLNCFCKYVNDPSLPPQLGVDPNLAKQIPEKCNLKSPTC